MRKCRGCGSLVDENCNFCPKCGYELVCRICGYKLEENFNFCPSCGELRSFASVDFIDHGYFIELKNPVGNIMMIQKEVRGAMNFNDALACCSDGWRIPTIDDLKTIYKIKDVCGIEQNRSVCWSTSAVSDELRNHVWCLDFNYGIVGYSDKEGEHYFYLVKERNNGSKRS